MAELESVIEKRLIDQLCCDESQWTYRPDLNTEEKLWANFKKILEQNNKAKLNDTPLSESEFAKVKNDLSHASFYEAGKWLIGENGKVYVHVQRGNETLHLVVLNNEHIAGGTSVYEVINQYNSFKLEEGDRDRRFDVTLLINGIPMIHIELKNKEHSYKEGFRQIKKYIQEGKFHGLFSNIQMFVVSNAVDTKYFAAARDTELNDKFLSGWLDHENQPVCDYIEFAKNVLRIPEAHEMVSKYVVLDNDKRKLLILRPYQIHAIESMRSASKHSESGFIWHTTGSGKTMTSYKATRNLLMDIPSIEKTIFLIDRKDLDMQTKMAFQSYAENDTIDVDDTENVNMLIKRLTDGQRQMIVTTRQKLQIVISKKLQEGTPQYNKIKALRVAFVVDECHRAVTPSTKREIEKFFSNSLWYGFTGTPIFEDNKYELKGDLPQTTEQLYGRCLHSYTIKEAIHDEAVLGFMTELFGAKGLSEDDAAKYNVSEGHMRKVLDIILNQSYSKLGMEKGRGQSYEAMLTVSSIAIAQNYYDFLTKIKNGEDELKISEKVKQALPDFPKFAITYSVTENDESSHVNQDKMKKSLKDYNEMFGTKYEIENINAYNSNLNDRLARKENKYLNRSQQLDLVIVVDRLLTGFDAPCLSTLFMDRPPMSPQGLIQAFSRTNRLFDKTKKFGQIVTFQSPDEYKKAIDNALVLYSRGGEGTPISEDYETIKNLFILSVKALRALAPLPSDVPGLSKKEKKRFIYSFRDVDRSLSHLKAFSTYDPAILNEVGFTEKDYEDYYGQYKNVLDEFRDNPPGGDAGDDGDDTTVNDDYDFVAFSRLRIDFEYIVELLQGFVDSLDQDSDDFNEVDFDRKLAFIREMAKDFAQTNPRLGEMFIQILNDIENDKSKYIGKDVSVILNEMRYSAIDKEVKAFSDKWFIPFEDVKYEAYNYKHGELSNENNFKDKADYAAYKEATENALPKFKFRSVMIDDFKNNLMPEIEPLL
ncbi:type I restriction endonuclease subunit R, EcoR124 family [Butyrivibrio sp. AC2005]|uniref:type I restriction endonuclease subunit R, EcoR124 family n=1 Tax=Butyrivibrio sp. AC2005 TaxID=1280672 RepID=UPI0003FC0589|nr:HsdR family type I site-specific deoxyribonuclease [Butyrivibrio sp. AC2005]